MSEAYGLTIKKLTCKSPMFFKRKPHLYVSEGKYDGKYFVQLY